MLVITLKDLIAIGVAGYVAGFATPFIIISIAKRMKRKQ